MILFKWLYNFILALILLIALPFLYFSYRKKGYKLNIKDRLVLNKINVEKPTIWFHCASVGEIKTALPVINYFKEYKEYQIILTIFSPRAYQFAKNNLKDITFLYLPFDFSFLIKKFIKIYKPVILIIEEAEFWFNLINETSKYIHVISINTSFPEKSKKLYKRFKFLYKNIFNNFSKFIVKTQEDRYFLKEFVEENKITVCGNLKILSQIKDINFNKTKKIILAGSTHSPEEEIIVNIFKWLNDNNLMLILAPRHLEKVNEVIKIVEKAGLTYSLRSKTENPNTQVYIIDTIGELSGFFKYADVVFIGGTVADIGGHNILEPIVAGKKVIIGKNFYKIKDLVEEFKQTGLVDIAFTKEDLKEYILNNLKNNSIIIDVRQIREDTLKCYIKAILEVLNGKYSR